MDMKSPRCMMYSSEMVDVLTQHGIKCDLNSDIQTFNDLDLAQGQRSNAKRMETSKLLLSTCIISQLCHCQGENGREKTEVPIFVKFNKILKKYPCGTSFPVTQQQHSRTKMADIKL